jgi:hypothetical protein
MQEIIVVYLPESEDRAGAAFPKPEGMKQYQILHAPWTSGEQLPEARFSIWHTGKHIYLSYVVAETDIRAVNTAIHAPVYEDSCVEFFISFGEQEAYYNFEFNCIGTCLAAFGNGRTDRSFLKEALVKRISSEAKIGRSNESVIHWDLTVSIPIEVFSEHQLDRLNGMQCRANFYKCGDKLREPHFLSWTNIIAPEPNFHLPAFFGSLVFE